MYKLKTSMRNQFYFEREQLRGKITMIKKFLIVNNDFLLCSQQDYEKRLDSYKNDYELFLAEDDTLLNLADYQQIFLNGCLMYLISQYEYYIKEVYKKVCCHTLNKPIKNSIVKECIKNIRTELNIKWYKSTFNTFATMYCIIEIKNKLVHVNGQSYNYEEITRKHINRHQYKIKKIQQLDDRLDVSLTPQYIRYVCNIIQNAFFSLTKSAHKKLLNRKNNEN